MIQVFGPCAAESREQVLETARAIKEACGVLPFIYRAGVWKPRTRPDTYQGAGEEGLAWLAEVKRTLDIPVATEVATPKHVEAALKAGIDYLWIGARTSASPIAVSAIGVAIEDWRLKIGDLKGILIKNPVNADAKLWLGNIERLEKTGIPVIAVHRGCNHQPCWKMAHEVRLTRPDIPMLLDPSHMSGDATKVPELLRKVEELGLDGAMVEVHAHPESALSDNAQQITPTLLRDALDPILSRLCLVSLICPPNGPEELNWLRAEIDELDEQLWDTIAARMDVSRRIGEWKKAHDMAPLQPERVKVIGERLKVKGKKLNLPAEFMKQIWDIIHEESLRRQE